MKGTIEWKEVVLNHWCGVVPGEKDAPSFMIQHVYEKRWLRKGVSRFFLFVIKPGTDKPVKRDGEWSELEKCKKRADLMLAIYSPERETILARSRRAILDFESNIPGEYGEPNWAKLRTVGWGVPPYGESPAERARPKFARGGIFRVKGKKGKWENAGWVDSVELNPGDKILFKPGMVYEDYLSRGIARFNIKPVKRYTIEMMPRRARSECWVNAAGLIVWEAPYLNRYGKVAVSYADWPRARKTVRTLNKKHPKFKFRIVTQGERKMWNNPNRGMVKVFLIQCVTPKDAVVAINGERHELVAGTNRITTEYPTYEAARLEAKRSGDFYKAVSFRVITEWRAPVKVATTEYIDEKLPTPRALAAKLNTVAGSMRSLAAEGSTVEHIAALVLEGIAQAIEPDDTPPVARAS